MTHFEHTSKVKPSTPCAAWHMTFNSQCLNCGWTGDKPSPDLAWLDKHIAEQAKYHASIGLTKEMFDAACEYTEQDEVSDAERSA